MKYLCKVLLILSIVLTITSCTINGMRLSPNKKNRINNWEKIKNGSFTEEATTKIMIEKYIKKQLVDENSVKFRSWHPMYKELMYNYRPKPIVGAWNTCVEVNFRDRKGDYVRYNVYFIQLSYDKVLEAKAIPLFTECPI